MDFQRQYGRHDGEAEDRYGRRYGDPEWRRNPEREARRYEGGEFGRPAPRFGAGMERERAYAGDAWDRPRDTGAGGSLYGQGRHPESSWRPGADALHEPRGSSSAGDRDYGSPADWREAGPLSRGDARSDARWMDSRPSFDTGQTGFSSYGGSSVYGRGSEGARFEPGYGRYGQRAVFAGPHVGKGPKGYIRSDERIKEQVSDRLEEDGGIDASEISVSVREGEVTLEGAIADRWMKRMAEELVEDSPGVKQVHNRLRVEKSSGNEGGLSGSFGKGRESAPDKANRSRSSL